MQNQNEPDGVKVSEHTQFLPYFKMLRVGVPHQAVKAKMLLEGIDASFLDRPDDVVHVLDNNQHQQTKNETKNPKRIRDLVLYHAQVASEIFMRVRSFCFDGSRHQNVIVTDIILFRISVLLSATWSLRFIIP